MKKLLIYPFTLSSMPILRYSGNLVDYNEVILVTESSFAALSSNCDVSHVDGGLPVFAKMSANFEDAVVLVDDVLFVDEIYDVDKFRRNFELAKKVNKQIFLSGNFDNKTYKDLEGFKALIAEDYTANVTSQNRLLEMPVPVIAVMGMGQQCNKFDIQMGLRERFLERGYKVSQVGTKCYSSLFGFHALPKFTKTALWEKILLYNLFFRDIVVREKSDVLIVGIPGGVMPIDECNTELFGETAIAISKSISPDMSILSMYLSDSLRFDVKGLTGYFHYTLGATLDYFHISNTKIIFESDLRSISYLVTDSNQMFDKTKPMENAYNVFQTENAKIIYDQLISELQENLDIM